MKLVAEIPDKIYEKASTLVKNGAFKSDNDLVTEALSRFIETQDYLIQEQFIREDIVWGLNGKEQYT